MLLGLTPPDRADVKLFGRDMRDARARWVRAMLQTGDLIRDVSVRELLAVIASMYRDPFDVDERRSGSWVSRASPRGAR
jgi:ABC-2 type transport system ATP-binding protein